MSQFPTYLLDHAAREDSHTLKVYREHGGHTALEKALKLMTPQAGPDPGPGPDPRGRVPLKSGPGFLMRPRIRRIRRSLICSASSALITRPLQRHACLRLTSSRSTS